MTHLSHTSCQKISHLLYRLTADAHTHTHTTKGRVHPSIIAHLVIYASVTLLLYRLQEALNHARVAHFSAHSPVLLPLHTPPPQDPLLHLS